MGVILFPVCQMRNLRLRRRKEFVQSHYKLELLSLTPTWVWALGSTSRCLLGGIGWGAPENTWWALVPEQSHFVHHPGLVHLSCQRLIEIYLPPFAGKAGRHRIPQWHNYTLEVANSFKATEGQLSHKCWISKVLGDPLVPGPRLQFGTLWLARSILTLYPAFSISSPKVLFHHIHPLK